jgi:hypothetical protein
LALILAGLTRHLDNHRLIAPLAHYVNDMLCPADLVGVQGQANHIPAKEIGVTLI